MDTVLIVEDEKELADILGAYVKVEGLNPVIAYDGEAGLKAFMENTVSLCLLDIMLPKLDGIELCKKIRETSMVPIIMVSVKNQELDKVIALGSGADDYVTKPFSPMELVARVKANLRRYNFAKPVENEGEVTLGRLRLNKPCYKAYVDENPIEFTTKEFEVLSFLASSPEQVFSKEQIYSNVWGYEDMCDDNSVIVYIRRIREKLEKYGVDYIKTVWGAGYKFVYK